MHQTIMTGKHRLKSVALSVKRFDGFFTPRRSLSSIDASFSIDDRIDRSIAWQLKLVIAGKSSSVSRFLLVCAVVLIPLADETITWTAKTRHLEWEIVSSKPPKTRHGVGSVSGELKIINITTSSTFISMNISKRWHRMSPVDCWKCLCRCAGVAFQERVSEGNMTTKVLCRDASKWIAEEMQKKRRHYNHFKYSFPAIQQLECNALSFTGRLMLFSRSTRFDGKKSYVTASIYGIGDAKIQKSRQHWLNAWKRAALDELPYL